MNLDYKKEGNESFGRSRTERSPRNSERIEKGRTDVGKVETKGTGGNSEHKSVFL